MEFLYIICQLAAADICETHRVDLTGAPPLACIFSAQAELARLARPGWRVASWRCGERFVADLARSEVGTAPVTD